MSQLKVGVTFAAGLLRRPTTIFFLGFALLFAPPVQAQEPLTFFKNYFVTGDYVVGGNSLWRKGVKGFATVDINIAGVPPNVDILAAFLYVQTAEKVQWSGIANATFDGIHLGPGVDGNSIAKALTPDWNLAPSPCWGTAGRRLITYRADVLRFLPIDNREFLPGVGLKNPNFRKHRVNGLHRVVVPDAGKHYADDDEGSSERDGTGPRAVGASLVVVYRDPRQLEQKAIVINDGGYTKQAKQTMTLTVEGFYQASATNPQAKMTHIVGDGRSFLSEQVFLGAQLLATNPFVSANGPKWDNKTFVDLPNLNNAASATVSVTPYSSGPDCLQYSAIIFSATVQDTDNDGLLDIWESSPIPLLDPHGQPLPNLHAMGANPMVRDLFVEIGFMYADDGDGVDETIPYGGVLKPEHTHRPPHAALKLVGDMFKVAPVVNPDLSKGIKVHFDLGDSYPLGDADEYIIRGPGLARGGETIDEMITICPRDETDPRICQYSGDPDPNMGYPGTVGWKTGFRFLKDEALNPADADQCAAAEHDGNPVTNCERRFDRDRKDMFRYAFFAHAVGMPTEPCLNPDGSRNALCQETTGDFHVPRTYSGIADFPGGDLLVTLGAFDDTDGRPVGTPLMIASTMAHELGHTFGLTHGGTLLLSPLSPPPAPPPPLPLREPNCKPNYLSLMNYLFQLRGQINKDGVRVIDYSGQRLGPVFPLDESNLNEPAGLGSDLDVGTDPLYRTGWYAPQNAGTIGYHVAQKYCTGADFPDPPPDPMVRIDSTSVTGAIDWNANGDLEDLPSQDINFNGVLNDGSLDPPAPKLSGSNDWANILLNQVGGRRDVGGLFLDTRAGGRPTIGPFSLDVGNGDIGNGDIGNGDIGNGDIGNGDIGNGDIGNGDIGNGDIGNGDIGRGLFGLGDRDVGGDNEPPGDIDLETAEASGDYSPSLVLQWEPTTNAACGVPSESPEVSVAGNTIIMGKPNAPDTASQNNCIHGASVLLPPLTEGNTRYRVTFSYSLFTWDSYNAVGTNNRGGTGYWDSFSVSVSKIPYAQLTLSDPLTPSGDLMGFWFWGGNDYGDSTLECLPSTNFPSTTGCTSVPPAQVEVHIQGNTDGPSYLNVVLDTRTTPQSNHAHPSYGTIKILSIVQAAPPPIP